MAFSTDALLRAALGGFTGLTRGREAARQVQRQEAQDAFDQRARSQLLGLQEQEAQSRQAREQRLLEEDQADRPLRDAERAARIRSLDELANQRARRPEPRPAPFQSTPEGIAARVELEQQLSRIPARPGTQPPLVLTGQDPVTGQTGLFRVPRAAGPAEPVAGILPRDRPEPGATAKAQERADITAVQGDVRRALEALAASPHAFGLQNLPTKIPVVGQVARSLRDQGDQATVAARAAVANVGTALGKLRSGGAITPQEFERLAPLIPQEIDSPQAAATKLREIERFLTNRAAAFGASPTALGPTPGPAAPPPSAEPGNDAALRQQALDALRQGAPRDAVAARFRQLTGRDLP